MHCDGGGGGGGVALWLVGGSSEMSIKGTCIGEVGVEWKGLPTGELMLVDSISEEEDSDDGARLRPGLFGGVGSWAG